MSDSPTDYLPADLIFHEKASQFVVVMVCG